MLVVAALMAFAVMPASAAAAVTIVDYSVTSANPQAGANSDVDISMQFCTANAADPTKFCLGAAPNGEFQNGLQRLSIGFPPGLVANNQSVPRCSVDTFRQMRVNNTYGDVLCPAGTQTGTAEIETAGGINLTLETWPNPLKTGPTDRAIGKIYNLTTEGSQLGRIGIFIEPDGGATAQTGYRPIRIEVPIAMSGANGYGVTAVTTDFQRNSVSTGADPNKTSNAHMLNGGLSGPLPTPGIKIAKMNLKLFGRTSENLPFMQNPTSCEPTYAILDTNSLIGSNGATLGEASSLKSVYEAHGCANVPFSPTLAVSAGRAGQTAPNSSPPVKMAVDVPAEQAALGEAKVVLPESIRPNVSALAAHSCAQGTFDAGGCPDSTRIGLLTMHTPLSDQTISGPIYLIKDPGQLRMKLTAKLSGPVSMDIAGTASFSGNRSVATFTDLPDVPVSDFAISLYGGGDGVFTAVNDLCDSALSADSTLTGANGKVASSKIPISIEGCGTGSSASIVSSTVDVDSGYAPIVVACSAQGRTCSGTLGLSVGGQAAVRIRAGATRTVGVHLPPAIAKKLARKRRLGARATVSVSPGAAKAVTLKAEPRAKKKKKGKGKGKRKGGRAAGR